MTTPTDTDTDTAADGDGGHAANRRLPGRTVAAADLPRRLSGLGNANWRAAAVVLSTLGHKRFELDAGYPVLEAPPAWSTTEKLRVRLAASLVEGDLGQAARLLGDCEWAALLRALAVAHEG